MASPDQTTHVQQLFVEHISAVKYFVLSLLPNPGEAEDVVQEVFLTVTAKAHDFEPDTNFKAWVFAITRFKVMEFLRRGKRESVGLSEETAALLAAEACEEKERDDLAGEQERRRILAECMKRLAPRARQMVELAYRDGLKPGRVAEKIGWKANAVYVALSRARGTLRKCVERKSEPEMGGV